MQEWTILSETEKESYVEFHEIAFKDDINHAEKVIMLSPRWSIISGYYGMHDLTKLFLAKRYSVKLSSPNIHTKAIRVLEEFIKDEEIKKKLLELLKEANHIYFSTERLKEKVLPTLLKK